MLQFLHCNTPKDVDVLQYNDGLDLTMDVCDFAALISSKS